jgi:hypothetical protein
VISPDALAAARNYLRGLGVTERSYPVRVRLAGRQTLPNRVVTTTWSQVLHETAEAIEEAGLIHVYAGTEHRSTRKRRAYREAEARRAQQNRRSEGVDSRPLAPASTESETAAERRSA